MVTISLIDYTARNAKGRVIGRRVTTYTVNTDSVTVALDKAKRTHQRRSDLGQIVKSEKITRYSSCEGVADPKAYVIL